MICFDTSPVIWGVQAVARSQQSDMVEQMQAFLRYLQREKIRIMVPTPVVFEYLVPFDQTERAKQLEVMERLFIMPSFDIKASLIAADLMGGKKAIDSAQQQGGRRQEIRIDAQIVAIALANGAEKIISHDPHVKTIAQNRIPVEKVPIIEEQAEMELPDRKQND